MTDTSNWSLQQLVDEHALFGYDNRTIREHLRESHGVSGDTYIPPPTRRAAKGREKFWRTGRVDASLIKGQMISSVPKESTKRSSDDVQERKPITQESMQLCMNEVAKKLGIAAPTVKMNEMNTSESLDDDEYFFSKAYRAVGQTLLDRLIHGIAPLLSALGKVGDSNFDVYRGFIEDGLKSGAITPGMTPSVFSEAETILKAIDASYYPWFQHEAVTHNIQIDAEMAEVFAEGRIPENTEFISDFLEKPIYIDIDQTKSGVRSVSGIFCRPIPSRKTFAYMAVVEWSGQGFEAFIFGEFGDADNALVLLPQDNSNIPVSMLDQIYDPIIKKIEKIAPMANMYCKNLQKKSTAMTTIKSMPIGVSLAGGGKKDRNREKTHSYFRVVRVAMPADRFGRKSTARSNWSLDHIVTVSGHLRWQPHGAGRTQYKLIWIETYDKGEGARHHPSANPELLDISKTLH